MAAVTLKPFAAIDIDGTLIRWQLYHAIADALHRQGYVEQRGYEKVRIARMDWKRRSVTDSFKDYERALVDVFDQAIKGLPDHVFEIASQTVFSEHKDQVYTFTRDLIKELKGKGYLLFAVSGSPESVVSKLANYYGFDDYAATKYPIENGYYTGEKALSIGRKDELLRALITKHGAATTGSFAVGDSEGDIHMLELAEQPIAFNPNQRLYIHAREQGWEVVVERKNVVFRLRPSTDGYALY